MLQKFNIKIYNGYGIGTIPISAHSLKEAFDIVQAYIDKHSLD